jgi:hypothetical protein
LEVIRSEAKGIVRNATEIWSGQSSGQSLGPGGISKKFNVGEIRPAAPLNFL